MHIITPSSTDMWNRAIIFLIFCLILTACRHSDTTGRGETIPLQYAKGFTLSRYLGYIMADMRDPWDTTRLLHRYILVPKGGEIPSSIPAGTLVRVPVERMAVYTSVHAAMIDELGAGTHITGVCEPQYIHRTGLLAQLASSHTTDIGNSQAPDVEKIIDIAPETIVVSPFENCNYGRVEKLGIPIIECADYMEYTPLGRAEWIRFIGMLTGKERVADSLFAEIERRYNELRHRVAEVENRPTVLAEKKTGGTWFVPGGDSYMARLFADAGADYIWKDDTHSGSLALSWEEVYDRAREADFWLIKYTDKSDATLTTLKSEYAPYARFKAYNAGQIYGCNLHDNTFFEEVPLHPDRLLQDLIHIFHPGLSLADTLRYYHHLKP